MHFLLTYQSLYLHPQCLQKQIEILQSSVTRSCRSIATKICRVDSGDMLNIFDIMA